MTPLYLSIQNNDYLISKILLNFKADPNISNINRNTPLLMAVSKNFYDLVELLLEYGANINHLNNIHFFKF